MKRNESDDSLAEQVEDLRLMYVASFAERQAEVAQAWSALDGDPMNLDKLDILAGYVHQLAGSAGTYGFTEIGQLAASIENLLKPAFSADRSQWAGMRQAIASRVEQLQALLVTAAA